MPAKALKLTIAGAEVAAALDSKITKDDLYGRVAHVVEQDGRMMERGYLLPDGAIFRKSQIAMTGVDQDGSPAEPVVIQSAGQTLELRASSFDAGEALEPVPLGTVARFVASDVYPVEAAGIASGVYKGAFNYRKSARARDALLMVREDGAFLLVGQLRACPLVGRTVAYDFFDAQDSAADDSTDPLDFSMM